MDSLTTAKSMRGSVGMLAMHWLMGPTTTEKAIAAGMPDGLASYAIGRLGVLGDCPVDNVVGAAFFWEPDFLRGHVETGRAAMSPAEGAAIYARICQEWGDDHLGDLPDTDLHRLGELLERVISAASPAGAPTFVGWRDMPLPAPGAGRTFQLCQTMRELGFARHCVAVQAAGMGPLEAIMSGPTGAWNATFFGWPEPYPDGEPLREARQAIEAHGNELHAADFEVLDDGERDELVQLLKQARDHVRAQQEAAR